MSEDEELRGVPEPDEAQKAAAMAEFQAFEEAWWRERNTLAGERPASPPASSAVRELAYKRVQLGKNAPRDLHATVRPSVSRQAAACRL